jgi:chromosome condensin MukBEF ATPase and DNA-binding subunit MukB
MLTPTQKLQYLQDCVALLEDVDAKQQAAVDGDICWENHQRIQALIEDFEADIAELAEEVCKP